MEIRPVPSWSATAALNYYRANLNLILPKPWPKVSMPVMGVWGEGDVRRRLSDR